MGSARRRLEVSGTFDAPVGDELENAIARSDLSLVHFWAKWNRYDESVANKLLILEAEFCQIRFLSCDIDQVDNFPICTKTGITNVPTVIWFVCGVPTQTRAGELPLETYRGICVDIVSPVS